MALLRQPYLHLSEGLIRLSRTALPAASLHSFSGGQATHRASQQLTERWASSAGASSSGSSFAETVSRRFLQPAQRCLAWPQLGGMSRRALSAQQVRELCTLIPVHIPPKEVSYNISTQQKGPLRSRSLRCHITVQNLDKGLASCAEETHGKSFHDAPDKVSFKAQVGFSWHLRQHSHA